MVKFHCLDGVEHGHHWAEGPNDRQKEQGHDDVIDAVVAFVRISRHGGQWVSELTGDVHCEFVVQFCVLLLRDHPYRTDRGIRNTRG